MHATESAAGPLGSGSLRSGLLMYRRRDARLECFLVHPGGPRSEAPTTGDWIIPCGPSTPDEPPEVAAGRLFEEATGLTLEACAGSPPWPLGDAAGLDGARLEVWATEGDWPADATLRGRSYELEWPPGSGVRQRFARFDGAGFFPVAQALERAGGAHADPIRRLAARVDPSASVYKLCPRADWDGSLARPSPDDLRDGFIHLSAASQVTGTLARHFAGVNDVIKLVVDPAHLPPGALVWERSRGGERFPHLYAPLDREAVIGVEPIN